MKPQRPRTSRTHLSTLLRTLIVVLGLAATCCGTHETAEPRYRGKSVSQWTTQLHSANQQARLSAAEALAAIGPDADSAVSDLVERLVGTTDDAEREVHSKALAAIGPAANDALLVALRDRDSKVQDSAARTLGAIGGSSVPALLDVLGSDDDYGRTGAVLALGHIGSDAADAVPLLVQLIDEEAQTELSAWALGQVGQGSPLASATLLELVSGSARASSRAAAKALLTWEETGLAALTEEFLAQDDATRRVAIVRALSESAEDAYPLLKTAMYDFSKEVRQAAFGIIFGTGPLSRGQTFTEFQWTRKTGIDLRQAAVQESVPSASVGTLMFGLEVNPLFAMWILSKMGRDALPAQAAVEEMLEDDDPRLRWSAIHVLAAIGPEARTSIPKLRRCLDDPDPVVRSWAEETIALISGAPSKLLDSSRPRDHGGSLVQHESRLGFTFELPAGWYRPSEEERLAVASRKLGAPSPLDGASPTVLGTVQRRVAQSDSEVFWPPQEAQTPLKSLIIRSEPHSLDFQGEEIEQFCDEAPELLSEALGQKVAVNECKVGRISGHRYMLLAFSAPGLGTTIQYRLLDLINQDVVLIGMTGEGYATSANGELVNVIASIRAEF